MPRLDIMENDDFEDYDEEDEEMVSEQVIGYLIASGAATWDGMDKNGERIYKFNMEVLKDILPELYDTIMEDADAIMLELFEQGLVQVEYDEDLSANFKISEEGKEILKQFGFDYFYDQDNNNNKDGN